MGKRAKNAANSIGYVTHGLAAVLAFIAGYTIVGRGMGMTTDCNVLCRSSKGHLLSFSRHLTTTPEPKVIVSVEKQGMENQFSTHQWLDEKNLPNRTESSLLVKPSSTATCQRIDVIYLQSQQTEDECLAILPCTNDATCQFIASFRYLNRLVPPSKPNDPWSIVPWQQQQHVLASRQKHQKPFRLETPPKPIVLRESWSALGHYLDHLPRMLQLLQDLVDTIIDNKTIDSPVTILLSNKGHIDLLLNFVCAWYSLSPDADPRSAPLNHILVFAVDQETQQAALQLGLNVFYDPEWLGGVHAKESAAAASYGTHSYAILMLAKVYCAHMMSALGRDFVFHDVDIVPLKRDYLLPLLHVVEGDEYDMHFQYDFPGTGSADQIQPEYRPWLINSGLYFVRSNARTRRFFDDLVRQADLVLRSNSHQVVITFLISEYASSHGLKVKVLRKEADLMPGM